ncbi:hypothetical protein NC653_016520 [Populus alba x Populus x berolinensis]|uniref:Uncharacterized protein n=1 Tax=Populus alba x Populus x berolinensis TaxID=444605 RepID=A0AAD6QN47_9ROSI|nr:hypothetical protein NC653_016520 [Populus alba x Populus x berolinensis]
MKSDGFNHEVNNLQGVTCQGTKKLAHHRKKTHKTEPTPEHYNTSDECAPGIPTHAMSPVHLLPNYRGEPDGLQASPRKPCVENGGRETDSPSIPSSHENRKHVVEKEDRDALEPTTTPPPSIQQANIF